MKKLMTNIATALYLAVAPMAVQAAEPVPPAKASVEVLAGDKSTILDTMLAKPLGEGFSLFNRNRITIGYEGAKSLEDVGVSSFHVFSLVYNIPHVPGLSAVAELDMIPGVGITPRIGAQYGAKFGDVGIFQLATVKAGEKPDLTSITNLSYTPKITEDVGLVTNLENVTVLEEEGHKFSTQRLRLGVDIEGYQIGAGVDLVEQELSPDSLEYNAGVFFKRGF